MLDVALPEGWFPAGFTVGMLVLTILAGFAAGFVDAVVGGGGLLQLPALLLVPGLSPVQALATNKLGSIMGTVASSTTYLRSVPVSVRTLGPMAAAALGGSMLGAQIAAVLSPALFRPIIIVALVSVAVFTALKPTLGTVERLRHPPRRHLVLALLLGGAIGAYDGMLGPGTGSFLVIGLVAVLGYDFLQSSAQAKVVNAATNLGALIVFVPHGAVVWGLGLVIGAANLIGGVLGARVAIRRGAGFVRVAFLIVSVALIAKLAFDVWTG